MCSSRNPSRYHSTYNNHHLFSSLPPHDQQHTTYHSAPAISPTKHYTCAHPYNGTNPNHIYTRPTTNYRSQPPMAALIIGAIAIGSHKIKQKRDERKKQRAIDEWGAQQVAMRSAARQERETSQPQRKSEEAGEGRRGSMEEEEAPPAYEEAVAQGRRRQEDGASRAYVGAGGPNMVHVAPLGPAGR